VVIDKYYYHARLDHFFNFNDAFIQTLCFVRFKFKKKLKHIKIYLGIATEINGNRGIINNNLLLD